MYVLWQVVANAKDAVVGAREAVTTTVTGAKETVAHTITGVVGKTKEAVQDSVEMTKSVVNGSINTVLGSRVVQMVSSGVDSALTKSETLVDQYLPLTEAELGKTNSRFDFVQMLILERSKQSSIYCLLIVGKGACAFQTAFCLAGCNSSIFTRKQNESKDFSVKWSTHGAKGLLNKPSIQLLLGR